MPDAARLFEHTPVADAADPWWSGELHGEVGAMHRSIEQRLLSGSFNLAVVPLPVRPLEELIARLSRATGWLVLAGAGVGVIGSAFVLLH